jgi:hypothetical protein
MDVLMWLMVPFATIGVVVVAAGIAACISSSRRSQGDELRKRLAAYGDKLEPKERVG